MRTSTYFIQPVMGPRPFLATVMLFLVVTCLGGGETESVSVSESSVRHGNQLTCGCLGASPGEAFFSGTLLLSVTLGFWGSSTMVHVQLS